MTQTGRAASPSRPPCTPVAATNGMVQPFAAPRAPPRVSSAASRPITIGRAEPGEMERPSSRARRRFIPVSIVAAMVAGVTIAANRQNRRQRGTERGLVKLESAGSGGRTRTYDTRIMIPLL